MKYILTFLIFTNLAFANYSLYFNSIKLGEIENFNTLEQNYFKAKVTNSFARFLLGKDYVIYYNDQYKNNKKDSNTKYKKDKYQIITILKKAGKNDTKSERINISEKKFIDVSFDKNYKFKYNSKGRIKSDGYFEMKNGKLIKLIETVNSIEISKNI